MRRHSYVPSRKHQGLPHKKHQARQKLVEVDESDHIDDVLGDGRVGQELLGLTDGQLREMYDNAMQLLEAQQIEGAIRGFSLLCQLHPYIADFWLGLGLARRLSGEPELALAAFLMAETLDCHRPEIISALVDCLLDLNDMKSAERALKRARHHAHDAAVSTEQRRILERELERLQSALDHHIAIAK